MDVWDEGNKSLSIEVKEPSPIFETFVRRLIELRSLQDNWDSYGALLVKHESLVNSVKLFRQVMYAETPAPQVVPTNRGNIQLEWHNYGIDLEIEICSNGSVHCDFADLRSGIEQEWSESSNYATVLLLPFIEELTQRAMTAKTTA